jgi:purine-nucleoside phosphorylase
MNADPGDFADTVLMPGDPLRAKYIAENFLEDVRQVSDVRNMLGFTGSHGGRPVSVMAHGMGIPSASIYCTELIRDYGVQRVIRVGSCGTVHPEVGLRDIVIAMGASTDSGVNRMRFGGYDLAATASFDLLRKAVRVAESRELRFHVGNVFSADLFYAADTTQLELMERNNILGVEMETAGIYAIAAELRAEALAICTVSDDIKKGEALSPEERQTSFDEMIELALGTVSS